METKLCKKDIKRIKEWHRRSYEKWYEPCLKNFWLSVDLSSAIQEMKREIKLLSEFLGIELNFGIETVYSEINENLEVDERFVEIIKIGNEKCGEEISRLEDKLKKKYG